MYSFLNLKHTELSNPDDTEAIFLTSEKILQHNNFTIFKEPIACITEKLTDTETYYVMHEHIIHKGKVKILKGKIVISDKASILNYLADSIGNDDLRPIRILPVVNASLVITVTDEGSALFFE